MAYSITGLGKIKLIEKQLKEININPKQIIDWGGNKETFLWVRKLFPNSKIYSVNNFDKHLLDCDNPVLLNAEKEEKFFENESSDLIFALDIIEHLTNPDIFIGNCLKELKKGGILIITTPNLACLFNRIFLLLGWSFSNYHASSYKTGNPLLKINSASELWNQHAHKSVFTSKQLVELLDKKFGFEIIKNIGFTYATANTAISDNTYSNPRMVINKLLPNSLKEGILIFAMKK